MLKYLNVAMDTISTGSGVVLLQKGAPIVYASKTDNFGSHIKVPTVT